MPPESVRPAGQDRITTTAATVQERLEAVLEQTSVSDDATAARRMVATILREWADEADRTPDAPCRCPCVCGCPSCGCDPTGSLGWWAISGDNLLALLRRAHNGEDPNLIYAEEYANSDHEEVHGDT